MVYNVMVYNVMNVNVVHRVVHRSLLALLPTLFYFFGAVATAQPANTAANAIVNQARTSYVRSGSAEEDLSNSVSTTVRPVVIDLQKTASPSRVGVGDTLTYTLKVTNLPSSVPVQTLQLVDTLPAALRFVPSSARAAGPTGEVAVETEIDGATLRWTLADLAPGEFMTLTFETTVLPTALFETDLVNEAEAFMTDGAGLQLAGAASAATTAVELDVFEQRAVLLGTAFVDANANGLYDSGDGVVPNLRLYLSDGSETVTDEFGRYTFQNVEPSLVALRVDTTTTPARLFEPTSSEDKSGLWRVRLLPGVVTRRDIPFKPARVELSARQVLNVTTGPLSVEKRLELVPGGILVILEVGSSEALRAVTVREALPSGATLVEAPGASSAPGGLEFALGDVPAGDRQTLSYTVAFADAPETLLTAPELSWDVR